LKKCHHCDEPSQTIEHLFWFCPETRRTYAGLNRQGPKQINQDRRLQDLETEDDPTLAYKLKVMHTIYIINILKLNVDAETIRPSINAYIATAKTIAEDRERLPQFLRLWH